MDKPRVGIVGVGNMGGAMAARLLATGWPLQVCDIDAHRARQLGLQGAQVHHTPAQCAGGVAALIVCVVDSPQIEAVLFGPAGAATVLRSGQDVRARDGTMSLMLACDDAAFERQRALVETLSSKAFRISARPGDGARTKLVNNLLAAINLVGAAEAIALAGRLGLAPEQALSVIEQSSGQSWIGSDRMRRAIAGDFEPRAHMTLLEKDTRLALQAAAAAGFEGPLGAAAHAVFARACAAGLADQDDGALLQLLRQPPPR
jgi:putative dehydrogenase